MRCASVTAAVTAGLNRRGWRADDSAEGGATVTQPRGQAQPGPPRGSAARDSVGQLELRVWPGPGLPSRASTHSEPVQQRLSPALRRHRKSVRVLTSLDRYQRSAVAA